MSVDDATRPIKASVLNGAKDLAITTRSLDLPAAGEVQIAVQSTGICGSDLHYYNHFRIGDIPVQEPLTLGHESTGIVTAIGPGVTTLSVGDAVALEVGVPCDSCFHCSQGRYNICPKMRFRSSAKAFPHAQGTLQERINHPVKWCHRLPEGMSLSLGALTEPLCVAIHATNRAALRSGVKVLVLGAGAVGLLVAAMCKINGAGTVVISDVDEGRSNFAVKHRFADHSVIASTETGAGIDEDLELAKKGALRYGSVKTDDGEAIGEFDAVFECTGVQACLQTAIYATRPGGKVMILGMGSPVQTLPISAAALREVDLCGVFRYANAYPRAIEVLSSSAENYPDFASVISHSFDGLEAVEDAFGMACRKTDEVGKLVLKVVVNMPRGGSRE
ncbi:probable sorbitol dehydrogenase [Cephalotrichum gorgonifer]|uniref:Probable sorbitol dehydrogenase n=1 Tax=Cephalotrichum gorgonifer TaxID=2041049 RepID=A0AAE8SWE1_9PEZI|nr:probable sorbitol dehydrogenase [Cephalotrichum gorgonifer]